MPEKKTVKPLCSVLRYAVVFLASALLMFGLTVLSALIPKETIRGNALASAEYLGSGDAVIKLIDKTEGSYINRKNDAAALGIAWQCCCGSIIRMKKTSPRLSDTP